ncbi:MAG: hypothetical protein F6K61_12825 [Sphaerospermopsis sp. SIO1G1]|nr:hypothetical protein [Sphaerospermopsis sp. SIO1G1]
MSETVRETPRISVNKLSEYVTALPGRRKTIIKQQKRPSSFIVPYYKDAENILIDYLSNHNSSEEWLNNQVQELLDKEVSSTWAETRRNICIDALESFMEFAEYPDVPGLVYTPGKPDPAKLHVCGVNISLRPEIYLTNQQNEIKGCIKLVFAKSHSVSKQETTYTGVSLQRWMNEQYQVSDHKLCFVLDIFGKQFYTAPKNYKQRMLDIEAACEEIARAWDQV